MQAKLTREHHKRIQIMYISQQYTSVLKLCMHAHDPKWEKETKFKGKNQTNMS